MRPPHVAFDLRILDRAGIERSGIGRYARESLRALRAARPEWDFTVHSNRRDLLEDGGEVTIRRTRWPTAAAAGRIAWLHLSATRAAGGPRPDLWFAPAFVVPPSWRGPSVVTIHDLVFRLEPDLYRSRLAAKYVASAVQRSAEAAARIICPSPVVRDRLVTELGIDAGKVVAAPWGINPPFLNAVRGGGRDYVLFVGRHDPRKGLEVLQAAIGAAGERGHRLRLMLAGGADRGGRTDPGLAAGADVVWVPRPSDEELATLYAEALALVYPSRMEGFGFPVAEAMACGCPVIASDLPEIRAWAADAPLYVPPGDPNRLADALITVATDLRKREEMTARGRELTATRTWRAYGEAAARTVEAALEHRSTGR